MFSENLKTKFFETNVLITRVITSYYDIEN